MLFLPIMCTLGKKLILTYVLKRKIELWQIWQNRQQGRKIRLWSLHLIIPKVHIVGKKDINVFMSKLNFCTF